MDTCPKTEDNKEVDMTVIDSSSVNNDLNTSIGWF